MKGFNMLNFKKTIVKNNFYRGGMKVVIKSEPISNEPVEVIIKINGTTMRIAGDGLIFIHKGKKIGDDYLQSSLTTIEELLDISEISS
jgi:hypothetical protein